MGLYIRLFYLIGVRFRNPSLLPYLNFLQKSDKWSYDELLALQFEKLKQLLCFAYQYSDFYKAKFDELSFNPDDITSISDILKLPVLTKSDLIKYNSQIHTKYHFKKRFFSETSGTSGQVLRFYRNEEWDSHNRAAMFRGYSWYGVTPWDNNGYFWGYNINHRKRFVTKILDLIQNRFRIFSYNEHEIVRFTKKLQRAKFLHGYSSMIYEVAKHVNELGLSGRYNLKMIKGTSEKIFDNYHDEVQNAFGLKIISEYGSAETGIIAYECPSGAMHIAMENVIVEDIDGEIVVTNLLSKSFPIIRYKLGDSVKLAPKSYKCSCGRQHPVILDVLGRIGKKIYGYKNTYPSLTFYYVFKNLALNNNINLNYQAVQKEVGVIDLKIEQALSFDIKLLEAELDKYFQGDITYKISFNESLHSFDGKLKDFISELN